MSVFVCGVYISIQQINTMSIEEKLLWMRSLHLLKQNFGDFCWCFSSVLG
jgi:hypothetical protein